jgi:acetyl-CoA carboxylase carboxyltransferase component
MVERGYIDDVIMPHSTRRRIARAGDAQGQEGRDAGTQARQFAGVTYCRNAV